MIKRVDITETQHLLWDHQMDKRAKQAGREARIVAAMWRELGGKLNDPVRWDETERCFYLMVPDGENINPGSA